MRVAVAGGLVGVVGQGLVLPENVENRTRSSGRVDFPAQQGLDRGLETVELTVAFVERAHGRTVEGNPGEDAA